MTNLLTPVSGQVYKVRYNEQPQDQATETHTERLGRLPNWLPEGATLRVINVLSNNRVTFEIVSAGILKGEKLSMSLTGFKAASPRLKLKEAASPRLKLKREAPEARSARPPKRSRCLSEIADYLKPGKKDVF